MKNAIVEHINKKLMLMLMYENELTFCDFVAQ